MSSSRLPGKCLLPVAGVPLAVLCACRAANRGREVVVATSDDSSDDLLASTVARYDIAVVRGSLDDVLGRFSEACSGLNDDDTVVRLTADNPFVDGGLIEAVEERYRAGSAEYYGTRSPVDGLPYGLSVEVFSVRMLRAADREAGAAFEREHVTPWIRREAGWVPEDLARCFGVAPSGHLRCTVDAFDDFSRVNDAFRLTGGRP